MIKTIWKKKKLKDLNLAAIETYSKLTKGLDRVLDARIEKKMELQSRNEYPDKSSHICGLMMRLILQSAEDDLFKNNGTWSNWAFIRIKGNLISTYSHT
jgi:hypothetical protein